MFAAYTYHVVNLGLSIGLLVLLLGKLSVADYAFWIAFATMTGFSLQLQAAIQNVVVREIALEHKGSGVGASWLRARRAYRRLGMVTAGPLYLGGCLYLWSIGGGATVFAAWTLSIASFTLIYWFGSNNALLLGTEQLAINSHISTLARIIYIVLATVLTLHGGGLIGIMAAFAVSSIASVLLSRRVNAAFDFGPHDATYAPGSVGRFALFSISSFALYNGGVLIGLRIGAAAAMTGYGLAIQVATLLLAVATVPAQGWLGHLSAAIVAGDRGRARRHVRRTLVAGNLLFVGGYVGFAVVAPRLLPLIGGSVRLPGLHTVGLIGAAYLVELNILLLSLFLTSVRDYRFTVIYCVAAMIGLAAGTATAVLTGDVSWLVAVPLVVQASATLPLVARLYGQGIAALAASDSPTAAGSRGHA